MLAGSLKYRHLGAAIAHCTAISRAYDKLEAYDPAFAKLACQVQAIATFRTIQS